MQMGLCGVGSHVDTVVKRELRKLINCFIYILTLNLGHKLWVVTEGMSLLIHAVKVRIH